MTPEQKLDKATRGLRAAGRVADAARGALELLVDVEREDGDGRVDRVTLLGFLDVYDRARGARRRARRRDRQTRREARKAAQGRDAP